MRKGSFDDDGSDCDTLAQRASAYIVWRGIVGLRHIRNNWDGGPKPMYGSIRVVSCFVGLINPSKVNGRLRKMRSRRNLHEDTKYIASLFDC